MITFLFTDIEGSTALWERFPEAMRIALRRHDALLREIFEANDGHVFKSMGDAFCVAFKDPAFGVRASLEAQTALIKEAWPETGALRVRMALHTGPAEFRDADYFGPTLNRAARLLAIGHGGQVLVSGTTYDMLGTADDLTFVDLGSHRLKDLTAPERVRLLRIPSSGLEFPPLRSLNYLPTNLPPQLTSFIGREREIDSVEELLGAARLLTITGSGGTGKTRISLQVAADLLDLFPDGIWFVELAALNDPYLVSRELASVLNIREVTGEPIVDTIVAGIKLKKMLLVLDNCEHLLDAVATIAGRVLRECPDVKMMATSREAIGIAGERIYRLPSLGVPDRKRQHTVQSLADYESVRLFAERAVFAKADFELTADNAAALTAVCQRLDGIPLAIELAAARVRAMPVEEIERRLDVPFKLLTGGSRGVLPRQQTLRALIDWSYELLSDPEKVLLRRLSVFRGGWRLDDAEESLAYDGIESGAILDFLTSLVDKSLVIYEDVDGFSRYRLLETVRQYGWDRLNELGEDRQAIQHHLAFYVRFAEKCIQNSKGPEQAFWFRRLDEDLENVRAAHDRALIEPGTEEGLKLCYFLRRFWMIRGHFSEGRELCSRALKTSIGANPTVGRGLALFTNGLLSSLIGEYEKALPDLEEAAPILEREKELVGLAEVEDSLGNVTRYMGDFDRSLLHLNRALSINRQLGNARGEGITLNNLGRLAESMGDLRAAKKYQEECLAVNRNLGDQRTLAIILFSLALVEIKLDEFDDANAHLIESVNVIRGLADLLGIANLLEALANLSCRTSRYSRAVVMWGAAEVLREKTGAPMVATDRPQHEAQVEEAKMNLSLDLFAAEWAKGRALSLDEAVDFAANKS
jgi:predicted ATPase/class 3 adenylate cyclase